MKLLGWVQGKIGGRGKRQPSVVPSYHHLVTHGASNKEELNDWPNGLLTIGTFGNNASSSSQKISGFTPEEVRDLQKTLTKLLKRKPTKQGEKGEGEEEEEKNHDLPLERFLNCPSSLEISRRISNVIATDPDFKEDDIERTISVIIDKCKEVCAEKTKKDIGKKSFGFLFKWLVCSSGFAPPPSLRGSLHESRMEKLLRTMVRKKINSHNSPRASSVRRYIEDKRKTEKEDGEKDEQKPTACDGAKWVKTDSEYIVLEI